MVIKKFRLAVLSLLCVSLITGQIANALDYEFYSGNDITLYNPDGAVCDEVTSVLDAGSQQEKIWSWLRNKGMSEQGTAGIMGNMQVESGFNPFRLQVTTENFETLVSNSGYNKAFGLVQWDGGRRVEVLKYIAKSNESYKQYVSSKYGSSAESYLEAPADINDTFLTLELEYIFRESNPGPYGSRPTVWKEMLASDSPESAADKFEEIFEGSIRGAGGPHSDAARQIFDNFTGKVSTCEGQYNGNGTVDQGGLTYDQAKQFMMNYGANRSGDSSRFVLAGTGKPSSGCLGGLLSNCTSFSAFFVNKFSTEDYKGGDGSEVVGNLDGSVPRGNVPKVFSVFSMGSTATNGHTGIVLGIHGDEIIVGHASCGSRGSGMGDGTLEGGGAGFVRRGKIGDASAWYAGGVPTKFAYLRGVETSKIEGYINGSL